MKYETKYKVVECEDETSRYDPQGFWVDGLECYHRVYKMLVPIEIENEEEITKFIEDNTLECYFDYSEAFEILDKKINGK